jgi:hypothetical protein
MIPKIMAPRRDGRSSFQRLEQYLTVEQKHGSREWIARGPVMLSANIFSLESAAKEMRAAAAQNPLVESPVMHFQTAWPPGERPTETQWRSCAERMIQELGFGEHQYLIAAHDDKEHFHVHVMLNRVHPETAKAHNPRLSRLTLHRVARELEHEFGWAETDGLYRWDRQRNQAVRNTKEELEAIRDRREQTLGKTPQQMSSQDHFREESSLKVFAAKQPAATIRKLLAGEANWQRFHQALSRHGLAIYKAEQGGYTVGVDGSEVRVKASDVFRFAFSGKEARSRTEAKLGPYEPARPLEPSWAKTQTGAPRTQHRLGLATMPVSAQARVDRIMLQEITHGTPGHRAGVQLVVRPAALPEAGRQNKTASVAQTPAERRKEWLDREAEASRLRRLQQIEKRAGERQDLKREFQLFRSEEKAVLHQHVLMATARRSELKAGLKHDKATIRGLDVPWQIKQAMQSVLTMELLVNRQKLNLELMEERRQIPQTSFQPWVEQRAAGGDTRAIAQMRGWHYQDSRNLRKIDRGIGKAMGELRTAPTAAVDRHAQADWQVMCNERLREMKEQAAFHEAVDGMRWKADSRTGELIYNVKGIDALIDRGKLITVLTIDRNATRVALQMAIHKYGGRIDAKGTAKWKDQLIEAAVQDKARVVFTDPELQQRFISAWKLTYRPKQHAEPDLANAEAQFRRLEAEHIARYGYGVEPVQADSLIAKRMASGGISEGQIAEVLRRHSCHETGRGTPVHAAYSARIASEATAQTKKQMSSKAQGIARSIER